MTQANNRELTLILPRCEDLTTGSRLRQVLARALNGVAITRTIETAAELEPLQGQRILFAVVLGESAVNLEYYAMLQKIRRRSDFFADCLAAIMVDGRSELYTKSLARELVFSANQAGCAFIGRPLVEGTAFLRNFHTLAGQQGIPVFAAYVQEAESLVQRLLAGPPPRLPTPRLLVLHASRYASSNTLALWQMVKNRLSDCRISEICLENGVLHDCAGCPYTMCLHFGERGSCFYGGVMVDDVYPAVAECQALLLLCPNYNDALSANLTAFVNRLTALYRQQRFYDKRLYAIIVSGYSGSDIVAGQLIAALAMNKSFFLPARFCLLETANDAGSIQTVPGIAARAAEFATVIQGGEADLI